MTFVNTGRELYCPNSFKRPYNQDKSIIGKGNYSVGKQQSHQIDQLKPDSKPRNRPP
jgi:hypothetical protein